MKLGSHWIVWCGLVLSGCSADDGGGADGETGTTGCLDGSCGGTDTDPGPPLPQEASACLSALVWRDGLLATGSRLLPDGDDEAEQGLVLEVDPSTAARTERFAGEAYTRFESIVPTPDGGLVLGGTAVGYAADGPLLQKYAADGALAWEAPLAVVPVRDVALRGDEVLAVDAFGSASYFVVDEADGSLVTEIAAEGQSTQIEAAADGTVYVAGNSGDSTSTYVRRHGPDDELQWEQVEPAAMGSTVQAQGLAIDQDGGAIVAVRETSEDGSVVDIVFRKYDLDGNLQWTVPYDEHIEGGSNYGSVEDMAARPGGGFIAVGRLVVGPGEAFAFAYDASGSLLWSEVSEGSDVRGHGNTALAVTPTAVYIAGCDRGNPAASWLDTFAP